MKIRIDDEGNDLTLEKALAVSAHITEIKNVIVEMLLRFDKITTENELGEHDYGAMASSAIMLSKREQDIFSAMLKALSREQFESPEPMLAAQFMSFLMMAHQTHLGELTETASNHGDIRGHWARVAKAVGKQLDEVRGAITNHSIGKGKPEKEDAP